MKPKLIFKQLQGVQKIFCGVVHSAILQNGILLTCGDNGCGQLALGDNNNRNTFSQVVMDQKIIKFETNGSHSIMMLGKIFYIFIFEKMEMFTLVEIMNVDNWELEIK
jgi:alpha-tubulin suppressor-like RCC1 family protein